MATGDNQTGSFTAQSAQPQNEDVFPPFDTTTYTSQLVWLAITFSVFYLVISKVVLPRIAGILEQRQDKIADDLAEAERMKQETDEAIKAYEKELAEAKQNAQDLVRSNRETLNREIMTKRENAEAEIMKKLGEADARIEETKNNALSSIDQIATSTAQELLSSLVGTGFSETEVSKAVSDSMRGG